MKTQRINADKPHLWKADIAASVDRFNRWFMDFAPVAFRSTRIETTEHVKQALLATGDLRDLNAAALKANPGALPTLRMCTAPPLAVDRLVGLAGVNKNLVGRMEKGKLPTKRAPADLDAELTKILIFSHDFWTVTFSPGWTIARVQPITNVNGPQQSLPIGFAAQWRIPSSATLRSNGSLP